MSITIPSTRNERTLTVRASLVDEDDVHLCLDDPTRRNKTLVICVSRTELLEAIERSAAS